MASSSRATTLSAIPDKAFDSALQHRWGQSGDLAAPLASLTRFNAYGPPAPWQSLGLANQGNGADLTHLLALICSCVVFRSGDMEGAEQEKEGNGRYLLPR